MHTSELVSTPRRQLKTLWSAPFTCEETIRPKSPTIVDDWWGLLKVGNIRDKFVYGTAANYQH